MPNYNGKKGISAEMLADVKDVQKCDYCDNDPSDCPVCMAGSGFDLSYSSDSDKHR